MTDPIAIDSIAIDEIQSPAGRHVIAKQRNTYAKRVREMEKKRKAEEKRDRRRRKDATPTDSSTDDEISHPQAGPE